MVDWAEPEQNVDEDVMKMVKILYVYDLMLNTTTETITKEFNYMKEGRVERVKKLCNFAFVHFYTREDTCNGMAHPWWHGLHTNSSYGFYILTCPSYL